MNFLFFLLTSIPFLFSLPFLPIFETEDISSVEIQRQILENSLNHLSKKTINEAEFPIELSTEFLQSNQEIIRYILGQFSILIEEMFSNYGRPVEDLSLRFERIVHATRTSRTNGFGRRVSVLYYPGIFEQKRIVLHDDGMLVCLFNSKNVQSNFLSRTKEIENAIDIILPNDSMTSILDSDDFCLTCFEKSDCRKLKCCGKLHHRECLEKWWLSLEKGQPLSCPHCKRKVSEISSLDFKQ